MPSVCQCPPSNVHHLACTSLQFTSMSPCSPTSLLQCPPVVQLGKVELNTYTHSNCLQNTLCCVGGQTTLQKSLLGVVYWVMSQYVCTWEKAHKKTFFYTWHLFNVQLHTDNSQLSDQKLAGRWRERDVCRFTTTCIHQFNHSEVHTHTQGQCHHDVILLSQLLQYGRSDPPGAR